MSRQSRKLEHLKYALTLDGGSVSTGFDDFTFIHNALPDMSFDEVDLSTDLAGIKLKHPVIINAMTGGAADVEATNAALAELALKTGSAMALGSAYAAIENESLAASYKVVRRISPDGIFFANIGAHAKVDEALKAVEMIGAEALQIHLNTAQELVMTEGDRDFSGYLDNIKSIILKSPVPVIVKEVGCGISFETAEKLAGAGVAAIDAAGVGGTNFIAIEAARRGVNLSKDLLNWGIPAALSAVEVSAAVHNKNTDFMVSGGIKTPLEAAKALSIGAKAVGMAGMILKILDEGGADGAKKFFDDFLINLKRFMVLTGAKNIAGLKNAPLIVKGESRAWLEARCINLPPNVY